LARDARRVNVVEFKLLGRDLLLHLRRQPAIHLLNAGPRRVQDEYSAILQRLQHLVLVDVRRMTARQEVGVVLDHVLRLDFVRTKTKMRHRDAVGLSTVNAKSTGHICKHLGTGCQSLVSAIPLYHHTVNGSPKQFSSNV